MLFGFKSRKEKLEEELRGYARNLCAYANDARELADSTVYIDVFIKQYDKMLECMKGICDISQEVSLSGVVNGDPQRDYAVLLHDRQQDTRDAIKRCYDNVLRQCATTYRNDRDAARSLCEGFAFDIEENRKNFDYETYDYAIDLQKQLSEQLDVLADSSHMPPASGLETISHVDAMSGEEFERWCAELLASNGFSSVERCGGAGDQGVDIVAAKDEVRYAFQCKCYSSDLGNTPVQEVYAGKKYYRCQVGVVMTNRHFTKGAVSLADATGILLWDRDRLLSE